MPPRTRSIEPFRDATLAAVTAAYVVLAFADGGYSAKLTAAATIAVWLAVAVALAARLGDRRRLSRAAIAAGACLLGLALLTALSMAWADDAGRAFVALVRVDGYLGLFALVVLTAPRSGARAWLLGLTAGLTIVCAAALATRFDPSLFGGGDRGLSSVLSPALGRLSYPIGYWNGLAACMAIGGVLLAWLGTHAKAPLWRATAVGFLPLPLLALYLTSSRGGFAAMVAGGLALLAFERARPTLLGGTALGAAGGGLLVLLAHARPDFIDGLATPAADRQGLEMALATLACVLAVGLARYRLDGPLTRLRLPAVRRRIAVPVLIAAAALAVLAVRPAARPHEFAAPGGARSSPSSQPALSGSASSGRDQFWEAALEAFASRPIAGVGAGNFELYWGAHPEVPLPLRNAHSLYLETLAELGVVGLGLVVGFLVVAGVAGWRQAVRSPRAAVPAEGEPAAAFGVLAAGALSAGLEWTWQLPAAFAPVVVAAGLLTVFTVAGDAKGGRSAARAGPEPAARLGPAIAATAIAWASIWSAGVLEVSELKLDASKAAARRGNLAQAAEDARDASTVEPWSPEPRLQLALVEELGGDLEAARTAAGEAIDRAPGDWRPWVVAARIDLRAGNRSAALGEFAKAEALSPVPLPSDVTSPRPP